MGFTVLESRIFGEMFGCDEAARWFADEAFVTLWCRAEAALAQAEADAGVIPRDVADELAARIGEVQIDFHRLREGTTKVGYPILPLVELLEEGLGPALGGYLHWGATTQDIMDTAVALQLVQVHGLIERDLGRLEEVLARLAARYRDLPMVGRTHGQHAVPITLGYKFGVWLGEIHRHRARWAQLRPRIAIGQLSGAGGTLASLGADGLGIREGMCRRLGLDTPPVGWHTARDGLGEFGAVCGLIAGTLGKFALEVGNLQRNEIGELSEGYTTGRGSSSTMPQKRNPITSEVMIAQSAYVRQQVPLLSFAMTGQHERAMGEWQVEWIVLPEVAVMSAGLLRNAIGLLQGIVVDEAAMRRNLELTRGLVVAERVMMALAPQVGRQEAHRIVYRASAEAIERDASLLEVLRDAPEVVAHLHDQSLDDLLDPAAYTGNAASFVDAALRAAEEGDQPGNF